MEEVVFEAAIIEWRGPAPFLLLGFPTSMWAPFGMPR